MRLKSGVSLKDLCPQMVVAILLIKDVFQAFGYRVIITSGSDGEHSENSLHYEGKALDFRTRHVQDEDLGPIAENAKQVLGDEFDVVLEATHLHVEYDPD
jgi:uncharacterized protein YcbK (DUF882 family)